MKMLPLAFGLVFALGIGGASAQATGSAGQGGQTDDCAFLERSFQEVYDGQRKHRESRGAGQGQEDPAMVSMYVGIQNNIILLHTARGCDVSRLISMAREEAAKYSDVARKQ